MFDFVGIGVLVLLVLLFGALAVAALRARRLWVKLAGGIPAALLTLVFGAATTAALIGYAKINAPQPNPVQPVTISADAVMLARGEKWARACAGCHSSNNQLPLTGKPRFLGNAPFGDFSAPNLTQAHLSDWSDGEIIRAIREGVAKDGRSLLIMPSQAFRTMSDEDVQALVAYLRTQPADAPATPPNNLNVLGAILLGALGNAQTVQEPITSPVIAPAIGATPQYGLYVSNTAGCRNCHGQDLTGGFDPADATAHAPSLVAVGADWSSEQFVTTLRTGVTPSGDTLSASMPWQDLEKFSDDELHAIYLYLTTLK